jgi:hypothetical protein
MLLNFQSNYPIFLCNAILGETEKGEGIFIGQLVSLVGNWLGFYHAAEQHLPRVKLIEEDFQMQTL